ncbi:MAG: DUF58 domain-containing protein [Bacteroidetes bacterium]|nr:DUF58 domain-containing protein [Bacteroidota bacterium]
MRLKRKLLLPLMLLCISLVFYPYWLIQFILIMYVIVTGLSCLYAKAIQKSISIVREQDTIRIDAYEPITLVTTIRNTSRLPLPWLHYTDNSRNLFFEHFPKQMISLHPNEQMKISNTLKGYRRGVYSAGPITLSGRDPLGIFPWEMQFPETTVEIIIYPEIVSFQRPLKKGVTGGPSTVNDKVYEDHNQYRGLREYLPGDSLRTINWKASARFAKLQTMEYSNTLSAPACILLDLTTAGYPARHRNAWIERAISTAASLAASYCGTGQPVGFISNGKLASAEENSIQLQPASGYAQADAILSALAPVSVSENPEEILPLFMQTYGISNRNIRLFYIGPPPSEETLKLLLFLRSRGFSIEFFSCSDQKIDRAPLLQSGIEIYPVIEFGPEIIHPDRTAGNPLKESRGW